MNNKHKNKIEKDYYYRNKERICKQRMESYYKNHEQNLQRMRDYRKSRKEKLALKQREYNKNEKQTVLDAYGGKCVHCGISDPEVLCIDHIDNNGAKHRKELVGKRIYRWLIDNDFPKGFQILCRNCNWKKLLAWKREMGK